MADPAVLDPPAAPAPQAWPRRYAKLDKLLHALGGIPADRIVLDPPPGIATEQDCLAYGERHRPTELIDNTLVEKAAGFWEGRVALRLGPILDEYAERQG